jgi:ligand-binding sensor domain-containing protein
MKALLPLVLLSACLGSSCTAVESSIDPPELAAQYVQTTLSDKSGLPQNSINTITQTRDGYLWFGTEEGLARYDGVHVTVFDTIG